MGGNESGLLSFENGPTRRWNKQPLKFTEKLREECFRCSIRYTYTAPTFVCNLLTWQYLYFLHYIHETLVKQFEYSLTSFKLPG